MAHHDADGVGLDTLPDNPLPETALAESGELFFYARLPLYFFCTDLLRPVDFLLAGGTAIPFAWVNVLLGVVLAATLAADVVTVRGVLLAFHYFPLYLGFQ
ncbi:hypothetical protein D3C76_674110 [compost metagenome]